MSQFIRGVNLHACDAYLCASCLRSLRSTRLLVPSRSAGLQNSDRIGSRRWKGHIAEAGNQANPHRGFYSELLSNPLPTARTTFSPSVSIPPSPAPPQTQPTIEILPTSEKEKTIEKARIVFGSRLAGPSERRDLIKRISTNIAGVLVPPRPNEPDNCCMSGCVNCVWDIYREDLEDWAAKNAEAQARLRAQNNSGTSGTGSMVVQPGTPSHVATSMDDDGGGSDTNWSTGLSDDLFKDIPVGIQEFMKTEKKLKLKHAKEARHEQ